MTTYRCYLDTDYEVRPWPFAQEWREVVARPPASLPGAITDLDVFLPDDADNRAHVAIERQEASVGTEMAVYRDGAVLIVLLRLWDGLALAERFAPPNDDGAQIWIGADPLPDALVYVGLNPRGEWMAQVHRAIHAQQSGDRPSASPLTEGVSAAAQGIEGGWMAGICVQLSTLPGAGEQPTTLRFSAGRIRGDNGETIGWAAAPIWFPMRSQLGRLNLTRRAGRGARLSRADVQYDADAETGELRLRLADAPANSPVPVRITINTRQKEYRTGGEIVHPFVPEEGDNSIEVTVADRAPVLFMFEKWSGHRLLARYAAPRPLPGLGELRSRFAVAHECQERSYRGHGVWGNPYRGEVYGYDHHTAFPLEAYAWACLVLERKPVYEARVREACDRLLGAEQPGGVFLGYHFSDRPKAFDGGAFAQGSVGEALLLGYRVLGDSRLRDAARRAASAYDGYSLEANTNYMAFVLWHLAELYELTGDEPTLRRALWYTRHGVLRGLNPSGAHPGHNYYTGYIDITLKGLAKLLRVLPVVHPFRATLRETVIRSTNQVLSRQRASGLFEGRNRMYFGYQHTVCGLFEVVRALPEFTEDLEPVLAHMVDPGPGGEIAGSAVGTKELALMARYLVGKSKPNQERIEP